MRSLHRQGFRPANTVREGWGSALPSARLRAGLTVAIVCAVMGVMSTAARAAEPCPNEVFRTGLSANLPDCRAYELVTPAYKGGGRPEIGTSTSGLVSPDGSRVIVQSLGDFGDAGNSQETEGASYELTRSAAGWSEASVEPPASLFPYGRLLDASPDLGKTLWALRATSQPLNAFDLYVRDADGALHDFGPALPPAATEGSPGLGAPSSILFAQFNYAGASSELTHVLFKLTSRLRATEPNLLWPGDETATGGHESLYEYTAGEPDPTLVGVKNSGPLAGHPNVNEGAELVSQCGADLGGHESNDTYNAISESGATVFFTATGADDDPRVCTGAQPPVAELDARLASEKTVKISSPSYPLAQGKGSGPEECDAACEASAPADGAFQGASRDGSKVFFLTKRPLLNGDTDSTTDLYEAEIEGEGAAARLGKLVLVSHDPHAGQAAEVEGVSRVSEDGSHVYFVARGELASNSNGQAAAFSTAHLGAENLYVHEPDPATPGRYQTVFIAMLCSEAGVSGSVKDTECHSSDSELFETHDQRPVQATPDGDFLVFLSTTSLTAPEDNSTASQVFRYDALTGELTRVSVGQKTPNGYLCATTKELEEGFNCNGNTSTFNAKIPTTGYSGRVVAGSPPFAISNDGSYVVFSSPAQLTPQALAPQLLLESSFGAFYNRYTENVYEYHEGQVSLISDGQDATRTYESSSVSLLGMTGSGEGVFFQTADRLVGQDTDTQQDLYDARMNGGFPSPPVSTLCREAACQGPSAAAPSFGAPSSTTFSGAGNLTPLPPASVPPAVGRVKVLAHSVHGTTVTLKVAAPAEGTIVAYGAGLQTTEHRVGGAMTYTLKVALSARARASVKRLRRHKLRHKRKLTVRVRFVPTSGKASQTSVLAMVKA